MTKLPEPELSRPFAAEGVGTSLIQSFWRQG